MQKKQLGKSSIRVAPLVLGGNVFGWTADATASVRVLDAFVDHGLDFIDTADMYSTWVPGHQGGESETIIGNWLAESGKRQSVVLATKVGMAMGDGGKGLKPAYIQASVDNSLRRLKTDYIDLYQAHVDDLDTPLEETLVAFHQLIQSGKVKAIGASNYTGLRLQEALETSKRLGIAEYVTLQPNYNLYTRENYELDLAGVVDEYGLGVIPYFSLAAGFLTGKYKSIEDIKGTKREQMLSPYFDERGERILTALRQVAEQSGRTPTVVALSWLQAQPNIAGPIASATSVDQLQDLFASVDTTLTSSELQLLSDASAY
ncbi:MAG: aldo/keto reductase [Acidobacteriaceae bacterium]|nr:aldo/keto reductase [Acidobacteriaceae bacterium]